MKEEWKPDELRATSEEIRGAVMPKSITPDMVGGTLLGLVNAVGEVVEALGEIPREHVTVKVRGYDGTGGISGAGATVWLDVFHTKGYPAVSLPRRELTCDEEGVVEFDIPHGFKYAVFSQIAGLGASFQLVETAATAKREISLWNLPIGVKHLFLVSLLNDAIGRYRGVPMTADSYDGNIDWEGEETRAKLEWDADTEAGEYADDRYYYGILVSTADTSFVIGTNSKSEQRIPWCSNRDYGTLMPGIPAINNEGTDEEWTDCQNRARADMDGNMNTAKILDYAHNPTAADFCADYVGYNDEQRWLPSGGQAYLMFLNNTAINSLMTEANTANGDTGFILLPSLNPGSTSQWTHYEYWWTSTIYNHYCSWAVNYHGGINNINRNRSNDVRAVSAFHFEY